MSVKPAAGRAGRFRAELAAWLLALSLPLFVTGPAALAQENPPATTPPATAEQAGGLVKTPADGSTTKAATAGKGGTFTVSPSGSRGDAPDYTEWEGIAERSERTLANPETLQASLEFLRAQLVDWRAAFLSQQNANSARIGTLRKQIDALGPAPTDGQTEAQEIADRRRELTDQLVRLQAPRIAAEEAYRRADGLIGEIDRTLRERQADQLLQLYPSPINPANWPTALGHLRDVTLAVWTETAARWKGDGRRGLLDALPAIVVLTAVAMALMWRGRPLLDQLITRFLRPETTRGRRAVMFLRSTLRVIVPTLAVILLAVAAVLTTLVGSKLENVVNGIPSFALTIFAAQWLGGLVFPRDDLAFGPLQLTEDRRTEGRFLASAFGLVLALEEFRNLAQNIGTRNEAAISVFSFPLLVTAAILLMRMGHLLYRNAPLQAGSGAEGGGYVVRFFGLLGRGIMVMGALGPVMGAVGYITAGSALVYSAAVSIGLIALLIVLQKLVADIYGLITGTDAADQDGLVPVLIGFAMIALSLPLFAMIWWARFDDLTELWQRFLEGFQLGETQVSPKDFMVFLIIFGFGYALTRMVQGALKGSVLPRTNLDPGGQTAIVSGVGYTGIFLSGLIAINYAGIDLSGLAIIAGGLSLGIGFGMQNIVSNFISGVILLVERPVSEGDWIEVGTVQGIVKAISVRSTRIQTFDRSDVIVPNADLVTGRVTNWTRFNLTGRLTVPVMVVHGSDTRKVERILRDIAEAQPLVVLNPPPVVALMGFVVEGIQFEIRMILRDVNFSVAVRSEVNHQIVQRFAAEGVEMRPGMAAAPDPAPPIEPAAAVSPRKLGRKTNESTDALPKPGEGPIL